MSSLIPKLDLICYQEFECLSIKLGNNNVRRTLLKMALVIRGFAVCDFKYLKTSKQGKTAN